MKWNKKQDWFWEGNVQDEIVGYMKNQERFKIIKRANPIKRTRGSDILAQKVAVLRQVAVSGYPFDKYTLDASGGRKREGILGEER